MKTLWCVHVEVEVGPDEHNFLAVKKTPCLKPVAEGAEHCEAHNLKVVWPV